MKDKTSQQALSDFKFDDDSVFSSFETPTKLNGGSTPQTTFPKGFEFPDEDDTNETPTKLEKTTPAKEGKPTPVTSKKEEADEDVFKGFGDEEEKEEKKPAPVKKQEAPPEKPEKKEKEEEEEEEEKEGKEGEGEEEEEGDEEDELDEDFYTNLALDLKDEGVFQEVELPKDKKLTREGFIELQDTEVETRFNEAIESFVEDMDEEGKDFVKHKKNGGSTASFFSYLQSKFTLDAPFDEDNPKHVGKVIDHYLRKVEGLEGEDLEDRKEWLKKGGKEITYAKNYFTKMEKAEAANKKALHDQLEQDQKDAEARAKAFDANMRQLVKETKKVGSFSFNDTDKKVLVDYINKPIIKTGKNKFVPKMHADLNRALTAKTPEDRLRLLALAKILAADFVLTDLEAAVETKVTKEAKARINKNTPRVTSGRASKARELADLFD